MVSMELKWKNSRTTHNSETRVVSSLPIDIGIYKVVVRDREFLSRVARVRREKCDVKEKKEKKFGQSGRISI